MRKINAEETEQLYAFTRAHYVEYYDVQTELVDHLASAMEANWDKEPELTYEQNLQREFKKFGIYGFSDVVEKKVNAMNKRYMKIMLKESLRFIARPKVLVLLLLFELVCFQLLKFEYGFELFTGVVVVFLILFLVNFLRMKKQEKKLKGQNKKIFLLEAMINSTGGVTSILIFPIHLVNLSLNGGGDLGLLLQLAVSLVLVLCFLIGYICYFILPAKKEELLREYSPEVRFLR